MQFSVFSVTCNVFQAVSKGKREMHKRPKMWKNSYPMNDDKIDITVGTVIKEVT